MPTDPFDAMSAALFAGPLGLDATYTAAAGGAPLALRVIPDLSDASSRFGSAEFRSETGQFWLLVADVAAPTAGDILTVDGETYTVQGTPMFDARRKTWQIEARPDAD